MPVRDAVPAGRVRNYEAPVSTACPIPISSACSLAQTRAPRPRIPHPTACGGSATHTHASHTPLRAVGPPRTPTHLGRDGEDTVGVHLERHFNLGGAAGGRRDTVQVELAQLVIVLGQGALALVHLRAGKKAEGRWAGLVGDWNCPAL